MEVTNLLDIHTRQELYKWYLENHDKVSDFWLRINRAEADCPGVVRYVDAGLAVAPDLNPKLFVYEDWVTDAIRADAQAWRFFRSCPENYRRIKVDRIQHYQHTNRSEYAQKTLQKFIQDCHNGKMQPGWSDFGRNDTTIAAIAEAKNT